MRSIAELCKSVGARYWEKAEYKRYYFNTNAISKVLDMDLALTPERKNYIIWQYIIGKDAQGFEPKLYFDLGKNKFSHNNCPEVCAVVENVMLIKAEGLDEKNRYENGVLKELLDDD